MKLAAYFPDSSELNRSKFYPHGEGMRVTLRIKHIVSGKVGAVERVGEGNIDYNFDFPKKASFDGRLRIYGDGYVGVQSSDLINQAVQELRPRTSYSFAKVLNTKFDLRALSYVLGAATAIGIGGSDFDVPDNPAGYRTLGTGWSVPDIGDLVFGPEIAKTPRELATLLSLCGSAGVSTCTILADDIPGTSGNFMVGRDLACYARRVFACIAQAAHETLSYGAHRKAYEHGKTAGMTLNAHDDEGGWLRRFMKTCSYPKSCGIVFGVGTEFGGVPLQENIPKSDITKLILSEYLEYVALFPVADYECHGVHSVISATSPDPKKPGDYDLLTPQIYAVMNKMRDLLCDMEGFHHDANQDINAHAYFVNENGIDRHFGGDVIMPWFFVEPAPLLVGVSLGSGTVAKHGEVIRLPLFKANNVLHDSATVDSLGRIGPGSNSWIVRDPTNFRMEGASYLFSSAYSEKNGLASFSVVSRAPDGAKGEDLMFIDNSATNLASARWVTPHNCMPCPIEGLSLEQTILKYKHTSVLNDPTPEDLFSGVVESRFGNFEVVVDSPDAGCLTHRDVPSYLKRRLQFTTEGLKPLASLKITSFRTYAEPLVRTPPPEDKDFGPDKTPARVSKTDLDPDVDEGDDLPLVQLTPADTGVKPVQPTVKTAKKTKDEKSDNGDPRAT